MLERLNTKADTYEDVYQYFKTRHMQLAPSGIFWDWKMVPVEGGYKAYFTEETTVNQLSKLAYPV